MHDLYFILFATDSQFNFAMSSVILMSLFFSQFGMLYTTLTADLNIDSSGLILQAGKPDSSILQYSITDSTRLVTRVLRKIKSRIY